MNCKDLTKRINNSVNTSQITWITIPSPPFSVMDSKQEKDVDTSSASSAPAARYEFYDPSKESIWTRLGLSFESFKRAPGTTGWGIDTYTYKTFHLSISVVKSSLEETMSRTLSAFSPTLPCCNRKWSLGIFKWSLSVSIHYVFDINTFLSVGIGGSIGTGLFVGSGSALRLGGPAGVLIAWILIGMMLINVTQVCRFLSLTTRSRIHGL